MIDFTACEDEYRKACEKYRSASFNPKPDAKVSKHRWRTFLVVELILLVCWVSLFAFRRQFPRAMFDLVPLAFCVIGTWLAFTLPIAFLYLIGRAPVMTLNLDSDSPESRAMARDVHRRVALSDDDFYFHFYEASTVPKLPMAKIRSVLRKRIDPDAIRLVPTDYLPLIWEWLDFSDLFVVLEREFGGTVDFGTFNGTLDSLIRLVTMSAQTQDKFETDHLAGR